jgi:hypothetical protein
MIPLFAKHWEDIHDKSIMDVCLLEAHNAASRDVHIKLGVVSDQPAVNHLNSIPPAVRTAVQLNRFCRDFAKTQTLSIWELLVDGGVRCFDLRVSMREQVLYVHHTCFIAPLLDILLDFHYFLQLYPQEMVVLKIKWTDTQRNMNRAHSVKMTLCIGQVLAQANLLPFTVSKSIRHRAIESLVSYNTRLLVFVDGPPPPASSTSTSSSPALLHPFTTPTSACVAAGTDDIPHWCAGYLSEYVDVYLNTNVATDKIAGIHKQLENLQIMDTGVNVAHAYGLHKTPYTIAYTLTPQPSDYVAFGMKCCGLFKSGKPTTLQDLNNTLPHVGSVFTTQDLMYVHTISMDFCSKSSALAELLLLNSCPAE